MRGWFSPLMGLTFVLLGPATAPAHRLVAEYRVLPGQKIQVSCRYKAIPRSLPAVEARIRVFRPNDQILVQGQTDDKGQFAFAYQRPETLRVEAYQEGHRAEVSIDAMLLKKAEPNSQVPNGQRDSVPIGALAAKSPEAEESSHEWIQQILIGVAFLLALAAFILSVRNARRVRELQKKLNHIDTETQSSDHKLV